MPSSADTATMLEPSAEATVNNVNSLIHASPEPRLRKSKSWFPSSKASRLLHAEGQRVQREISGYAQLSQAGDEIHAHDRRQCGAVETRRRQPSQQLTAFPSPP